MSTSPERLMEKYQNSGKEQYMHLLYDTYNANLFHYLLSLSDHATAKDIAQSSWLRVIEKKAAYQVNQPFKPWLFKIARNLLIDHFRKQQRWDFLSGEESEIAAPDTLDPTIDEKLTAFNKALLTLPSTQREAFIFQQEGFSLQEIALMTNEPLETIKSRLRYARNTLKAKLGAHRE